ncbi:GLPGLI family protein [Flavobacterium sp. I3-2]|uniref:GLPGLI family protein n=1 Tax=Flavobacterium sp. I3-2 TaxID=2748319 RepID=UPI0015B10332|nr:GLPGLI family protein [Flavobacterium sp. I3-2]
MYIIPAKKYVVNKSNLKWVIHDESKMINDFLCFKATSSYSGLTTKGEFTTRNVTAWFAPEINIQYGPGFFSNLPGLIVEVQYDTYFLLGLTKISYSDCNEMFVDTNIVGEDIDDKEFDRIQAPFLKNEFEDFYKNKP